MDLRRKGPEDIRFVSRKALNSKSLTKSFKGHLKDINLFQIHICPRAQRYIFLCVFEGYY